MSIKLAILKSGENVISDAKELIVKDKVCGYLFNKPHKVEFSKPSLLLEGSITPISSDGEVSITLSPWIMLSKDTQVPVPTDWIVTIVEPIDNVRKMYVEDVLKNDPDNQNSSSSQSADPD